MLFSRTPAAVALVSALAGCAHSLVYSESRDKQGQEAKRAAGELKLGEVVKQLERGYSEVAKLELESARSLAETLREKELGRVVRASSLREPPPPADAKTFRRPSGLIDVLERRMAELGAKTDKPVAGAARNCGALDCASLNVLEGAPVSLREHRESFELSRVVLCGTTSNNSAGHITCRGQCFFAEKLKERP